MTRDEILSALVDDVPVHRACRQALLQGTEFVVWDDVKDPPYAFMLFLALDQPRVIGCTGVKHD